MVMRGRKLSPPPPSPPLNGQLLAAAECFNRKAVTLWERESGCALVFRLGTGRQALLNSGARGGAPSPIANFISVLAVTQPNASRANQDWVISKGNPPPPLFPGEALDTGSLPARGRGPLHFREPAVGDTRRICIAINHAVPRGIIVIIALQDALTGVGQFPVATQRGSKLSTELSILLL